MPKFLIERRIPGAGAFDAETMRGIAQKSNSLLREMGTEVQWVQSYVTDDAIYCVYLAPDKEAVQEHARRGGFPADQVMAVSRVIDPTTAE